MNKLQRPQQIKQHLHYKPIDFKVIGESCLPPHVTISHCSKRSSWHYVRSITPCVQQETHDTSIFLNFIDHMVHKNFRRIMNVKHNINMDSPFCLFMLWRCSKENTAWYLDYAYSYLFFCLIPLHSHSNWDFSDLTFMP